MGFFRNGWFSLYDGDLTTARVIATADISDGTLEYEKVDWDNVILVDIADPENQKDYADAFFVEYIGYKSGEEVFNVWVEIGRGERPERGPKIASIPSGSGDQND